jgi:FHS family glucose/mannose:H+ symporter-like MFS transporter
VPFVAGMVTPPRTGAAAGRLHFGGALLAFSLVYFLYGGLETASGGWIATHLLSVGAGTAAAAGVTSAFWAALAVGRVLAAPLSLRLAPGAFVAGSLALAMVALALAGVPSLAPLAYPLAGLGLAPVYPTALVWLSRRVGPETIPVAVAASFLGGAAFPPLVGALISASGTVALPVTLLVMSGLAVCLAGGLLVRDRPASQVA